MPLYIKDDAVARLMAELALLKGVSKQAAVKMAVLSELDRASETRPLRERFAAMRASFPPLKPTGLPADKAFFDSLSGDI